MASLTNAPELAGHKLEQKRGVKYRATGCTSNYHKARVGWIQVIVDYVNESDFFYVKTVVGSYLYSFYLVLQIVHIVVLWRSFFLDQIISILVVYFGA